MYCTMYQHEITDLPWDIPCRNCPASTWLLHLPFQLDLLPIKMHNNRSLVNVLSLYFVWQSRVATESSSNHCPCYSCCTTCVHVHVLQGALIILWKGLFSLYQCMGVYQKCPTSTVDHFSFFPDAHLRLVYQFLALGSRIPHCKKIITILWCNVCHLCLRCNEHCPNCSLNCWPIFSQLHKQICNECNVSQTISSASTVITITL